MYEIRTLSGSVYTVRNGRLTRKGDDIRTDPGLKMTNLPFRSRFTPVEGRQWAFIVIVDGEAKPFTTSVVTHVRERVAA